jgi:RimJ/RimL family protein N-acetyltransferase
MDATNETTKAIKAITSLERDDLTVDVIVGAGNQHQKEIRALCQRHENIRFHCQIDYMAELMATADLAIGAGGTATWERLCLGLPTLVVSLADNQKAIAEDCGKRGVQIYLGDSSDVSVPSLTGALQTVLQSPPLLTSIADQAMNMVDGKGLFRVVNQMYPLNINLREAEQADCHNIYAWRNAEEIRRHIFDKEISPFETHQQWFQNSLQNKDQVILIGESNDKPVGVLRYDFAGQKALISVYLIPGQQPTGAGSQLIQAGSRWLKRNHPEIKKIHAEILGENIASIKAFEKAGYHLDHLTYCEEFSNE